MNTVVVTPDNFQDVIEASQHKLVMIDFWAEWCEPCKTLMPLLEKLAAEYANDLLLAKVDCDAQQGIAMQFGVRNLPTVMLVKDGQPIDGFAGVQTEGEIRALLEKHLPKPEDALMQQAVALFQEGDVQAAFSHAKQAYEAAPERIECKFLIIDLYLELGRTAEAKELLSSIGLVDQDQRYQALVSKLELAEQAADTPEIQALQEDLANNPDDMSIMVQLAIQLQQAGRSPEALDLLLNVLKKDLNFGDAKKVYLDTINALPDGDPLASQYRRKIYGLLY